MLLFHKFSFEKYNAERQYALNTIDLRLTLFLSMAVYLLGSECGREW